MRDHYGVLVVGSGYGGGIAASRLARAGQHVCVLERGREWLPGEFPDTEHEAIAEMQISAHGSRIGSKTALYDFHLDDDINVFRGCGLGGTSLVNANVALEADPGVFEDSRWPRELRDDLATRVQAGYQRARAMLGSRAFPDSWPQPPKLAALDRAAAHMGERAIRPPINVCFTDGTNHVGVEQRACSLCGDCVTGCNDGAKNTTAVTYIPDAWNHGAEIFCEVQVSWLERRDGRWLVHYEPLDAGREQFEGAPDLVVSADLVVLAAGALGSTEILLRSRERGLSVSNRLGHGFTGNGDVLGFGYNGDHPVGGIGRGARTPDPDAPIGPCITGAIDLRPGRESRDGVVIEEGAVPGALAGLVPSALAAAAELCGHDTDHGVADVVQEGARELESRLRGPYHGATDHTQTYLAMGHDDGDGSMYLHGDSLRLAWPGVADQPVFRAIRDELRKATAADGGTYVSNPMWSNRMDKELVTVHPLGGCGMGSSAEHGVVDHRCRVFRGQRGGDVHEGLYVADGSALPAPVGINPLLTIAAVAERSMELLCNERGWPFDGGHASAPSRARRPDTPGIRFTETMSGWFSTAVSDDFDDAAARGALDRSKLTFVLTIETDDLDAMLSDPEHRMRTAGTVEADALASGPLAVSEGRFHLHSPDPDRAGTTNMVYRMKLTARDGSRYFFVGTKYEHDDPGADSWSDLTTLYTTLHAGHDDSGDVVGRGILHIHPTDFARQLRTMQATGVSGSRQRLATLARFGSFFAGSLFDTYGGVFAGGGALDPRAPPRKRRPLRVGAPEVHYFTASDGVRLCLTRYRGGAKGPVILVHGLGVSSRIFSIDTIDTNLVEYLFAHGYDVWLLDNRTSIELAASTARSTGDEVATIDYPEAVARVRAATESSSVQMVVHCYGATTFFMAMLAGLEGVRSAVASQIAAHAVAAPAVRAKSGLHIPEVLDWLGVDNLTAYTDSEDGWWDKLYNRALSLQPLEAEERCASPVCHRVTFMYSLLYEHDQLNRATHDALHELFGVANVDAFKHLGEIVRAGHLVTAGGGDGYMRHASRLAIPITFIHGAENACYLPESTEKTWRWLCEQHGPRLYDRHVIPRFGHLDCIFGKDAAAAVYPRIVSHLEETAHD